MPGREKHDGITAIASGSAPTINDLSAEAKEIVRSYYGKFAWFSVFYQLTLFVVYLGSIVLAVQGAIPIWAGFIISTICAYYSLGPLHDAMHGNISGAGASTEKVPLIDNLFGWISSIPLIMPFSAYRMMHYRHHAHTNDPAADPDYYLAAKSWWRSAFQALMRRLLLVALMVRKGPKAKLPQSKHVKRAKLVMVMINYASLIALLAAYYYGYFIEAFLLWYLPSKVGTLFAEILTGYLPHYPFKEREHFRHSRIVRFWGSTVLLFGHDYHALHHLFPRIPFYKYKEAYARVGPELEKNGVVVDHLRLFSGSPKTSNRPA